MTKARPGAAVSPIGPGRWNFRLYHIFERTGPRGRRYEIRTPAKDLVGLCRIRKNTEAVSMFADEKETQEILRFNPKTIRQYAAAYDVVDVLSDKVIGEFRKKVYRPLKKSEWFIFNSEGEPIGMVLEAATPPTLLGRIIPIPPLRPKAFEVHWGQTVAGRIETRKAIFGMDHVQVDLSLDKKESIDRRLALGVAVLMRDEERNGDRAKEPVVESPAKA